MNPIRKKILVIDDEAVFREATVRALNSCGYSCIAEDDPSKGIMRLKKEEINLVLLDIMMDPVDGWDTLGHIRSLKNGSDLPIMMSSAKRIHPDEVIRYADLLDGFIIKPFVDEELCETISDFFSWYASLLKNVGAAKIQDIAKEVCQKWVRLNREIRSMEMIKELLEPQVIPDPVSGEDCFDKRVAQINQMIGDKRKERDMLKFQYPVFIL
ncbi:response regulator [Methanospirillum stamsii]|uniref:Response regulatory domain-containing protein n=1 Tax=Methanospirillum stamsii TaxID=1277351 RepID=A0A2V2NE48_9EURY|nr:response regulator [Methanospirillum stamsii]PWR75856.1 hypothetical protein DLD82_01980 [Methanospirillum stamsii]